MMNIRDLIFINKAKNINKIRILDILGFDTNSTITQTTDLMHEINENLLISQNEDELINTEETNINFYSYTDKQNIIEETKTQTFEPINITSQFKKLWIDIEKRRQWLVPATLILSTLILIVSATSIFVTNRNKEIEINNLYLSLTSDSNKLINEIEEIINISTDNFYSKYDVSNSSANLQLIESTIMEYERNLKNRNDILIDANLTENLNNIFVLVNDLDKLISYRILLSEILVYDDILTVNEELDIDTLSKYLSEVSAISKLNYEKLPAINEFNIHYSLLSETLQSAEDLHGRLIASLRNNEVDVAKALIVAIKMNKQIEEDTFIDGLILFKENKSVLFKSINILP